MLYWLFLAPLVLLLLFASVKMIAQYQRVVLFRGGRVLSSLFRVWKE